VFEKPNRSSFTYTFPVVATPPVFCFEQDDDKIKKYEETLRSQLADDLEAQKRENAEASAVACRLQMEEMYLLATAAMERVGGCAELGLEEGHGRLRGGRSCLRRHAGVVVGWSGGAGCVQGRL
jgi:hypothetical protein